MASVKMQQVLLHQKNTSDLGLGAQAQAHPHRWIRNGSETVSL